MHIIPKDLTIHALLLNPTEQLNIPSYQRRYAWRDAQIHALFEDIDMLQPDDGHLFGMLILHTELHHGGINKIHVVDGQQRLTTLSLLLNVLRNKFKELGDEDQVYEINKMLQCGMIPKEKENKIVLGELDNPDYTKLLKNNNKDIKNENLFNAQMLFSKLVNEGITNGDDGWLNQFYYKLVHTAKIIRLDVQQAQDAYKLFETINNRGLRLSATDILKNFILGHAAKIGEEKLDSVKAQWSELITSLDGIPTDDFFRQYVSSIYTRKITKSKLIGEFKNHYFKHVLEVEKLGEYTYNLGFYEETYDEDEETGEDSEGDVETMEEANPKNMDSDSDSQRVDLVDYLEEIVNAAKCYAKIWYHNFDDVILNRKLRGLAEIRSFPTFIFLMHYLQRKRPVAEQYEVLHIITTLILRRHICAKRTSENDNIFAKMLRIESDDNFLVNLKTLAREDYPEDEEFIDRFPLHELKGNLIARAKYILRELEYYSTGSTGEVTINSGHEVHLEHIIPQKITTNTSKAQYGDWVSYLGENAVVKHRRYVNRIGNMTLLAGELNITASNNPFTRKKGSYRKSNIAMTRELGESSKEFKFYHLEKRGEAMAETAAKIWKIS